MGKHNSYKLDNWQIILYEEINKPRDFKWGFTDCVCFCVDMLMTYTNKDFGTKHIGKFNTAKGGYKYGLKYFAEHNIPYEKKDSLNSYIIKFWDYHFPSVHINLAQRGDVVATLKFDNQEETAMENSNLTCGILLDKVARFLTPNGYIDLPKEDCQIAWRVK